jgi:hypothetical protein
MSTIGKVASTNTEATDPERIHPDNKKPLGDSPSDLYVKDARRRLTFNGSSYSGADIKVLVHKYHPGPVDLLAKFEQAISVYNDIVVKLDDMVNATQEIANLSNSLSQEEYSARLKELWTDPARQMSTQESRLSSDFGFNQYVGKQLLDLTFSAQGSPGETRNFISDLQVSLDNLLSGWYQQKDAINRKKEDGKFFQTKVLAELQTISVSTFREKNAVRAFGKSNPSGWVRGQRTIAGSMIFTVFDRNVLFELLDFDPSDFDGDNKFTAAILDQLPPMDITITFANEYGSLSRMTIYGVEFVSEGKTMSIENLFLESEVQYIARDLDPMTPVYADDGTPYSELLNSYNQSIAIARRPDRPITASDLIGSEWGAKDENEDASLTRFRNRYNPFF